MVEPKSPVLYATMIHTLYAIVCGCAIIAFAVRTIFRTFFLCTYVCAG